MVSPARAVELSSRADCSLEQAGVNGACESYSAPVGEFDLQLSGRAWIDDGYWHCATKLGKGESSHNVKPFIETLRVTNPVR